MSTWEDLAEQQEMLARAWTKRSSAKIGRMRVAYANDAADAAGQARRYREAAASGAKLHPGLATFLKVIP